MEEVNIFFESKKKIFLATTALHEFWDLAAEKIIFLGDQCITYSNTHIAEKLNHDVLPSPWKDEKLLHEAKERIWKIYEKFLEPLSHLLNQVHGMNENTRFWEVVIGFWLSCYIGSMYDHYYRIKCLSIYGFHINTFVLDEKCFKTPQDTVEFFSDAFFNDLYNLQIFSKLVYEMKDNISFEKKQKFFPENKITETPNVVLSIKGLVLKAITFFIYRFTTKNAIMLNGVYFHPKQQFLFWIRSKGSMAFLGKEIKTNYFCVNDELRKQLFLNLNCKDELEMIIKKTLVQDLPLIFLEGFPELSELPQKHYKKWYNTICSSNSWYFDEVFKLFAARSRSHGKRLVGIQHGGSYGAVVNNLPYDLEYNLLDRFYSWGWDHCQGKAEIRKGTICKTLGERVIKTKKGTKRKILYINTLVGRYNFRFEKITQYYNEYYNDQLIFIHSLNLDVFNNLYIRAHRDTNNAVERYKEIFPNIQIEGFNLNYYQSLAQTRLAIIDHLISTTACEAIALNVPTIIFWRPCFDDFTEEAKPIYEGLKKVGVFHDSPESAALHINEIYDDIEGWWKEPKRQIAVDKFRVKFAFSPKGAFKWWLKEFKSMVKEKW